MSEYVKWFSGLRRKTKDYEEKNGKRNYLLDYRPGALDSDLVISREMVSSETGKSYMNYTTFSDFVEFYEFLFKTGYEKRLFHEVVGENRTQKPRFDIDVDFKNYQAALDLFPEHEHLSVSLLGDLMKDMVIQSIVDCMKLKGYKLDLEEDIMVFSSHGKDKEGKQKSSYHIILNRYFHYGSLQAQAFYKACADISEEPKLFLLLVDSGIYRKNGSLRVLYCRKPGTDRVKRYDKNFTFRGRKYQHRIKIDLEEGDKLTADIQQLNILSNSLITFTDQAIPMPVFPVPKKCQREVSEISEEIYLQCKEIIKEWDREGIFEIDDTDQGMINMKRNFPSMCEICHRIHDLMPPFCYISQTKLYWHCGRAKGKAGIPIGRIKTLKNSTELHLENILNGHHYTLYEEDGSLIRNEDTEKKEKINNNPITFEDIIFEFAGKLNKSAEGIITNQRENPFTKRANLLFESESDSFEEEDTPEEIPEEINRDDKSKNSAEEINECKEIKEIKKVNDCKEIKKVKNFRTKKYVENRKFVENERPTSTVLPRNIKNRRNPEVTIKFKK